MDKINYLLESLEGIMIIIKEELSYAKSNSFEINSHFHTSFF